MRKLVLPLAIAVAALGFNASRAAAYTDTSCPNAFNVCIGFTLTNTGGNAWSLATDFYSSTTVPTAKMFATGMYLGTLTQSDLGISGITVAQPLTGWSAGCTEIQTLLGTCANSNQGSAPPAIIANGVGDDVIITFMTSATGTAILNSALAHDSLAFIAHVGGFNNCSLKIDTSVEGGRYGDNISTATGTAEECGGSSVPEPISMGLIGTGLIGLGFIRRRRRGVQVVDD